MTNSDTPLPAPDKPEELSKPPEKKLSPGAHPESDRRESEFTGLEALVVEDDPIFQQIVGAFLDHPSLRGTEVTLVDRLDKALETMRWRSFDAILLDLHLPDSRGLDTLRAVLGEYPDLPIIVLTSTDDDAVAAEAVRAGAQDFIVKTELTATLLARSIRYALERIHATKERRKLQEQLLRSQKMEILGRLVGGVAHDFNNLLTVITAYCGLMIHEAEENDREPNAEVLHIEKAAERAAALARQLLAVSRRDVAQPLVLDINKVVRQTQVLLTRLLGERVKLQAELDKSIPPILADYAQIEQILVNLAVNARDAMAEGGILRITTLSYTPPESSPEHKLNPRWVELKVEDDGVGIAPELQEKIFEPFFTTKAPGEGSGLGLSIVETLVKQSQGTIRLESEPGEGCRFRIRFPATGRQSEDSPTDETTRAAGGSGRVLLVEDEDAVRDALILVLKAKGYDVLAAGSAEEAIRLTEDLDGAIDAILSDVVLPRMNGIEMVEQLAPRFPQAKQLFMSGYADSPEIARQLSQSGAEFLQKPFSTRKLLKRLQKVLQDA